MPVSTRSKNRKDETAGGLAAFLHRDIPRSTTGLADMIAGMGLDLANSSSHGLKGISALTGAEKIVDWNIPVQNIARDDVVGTMNTAPQIPNPFPISDAGKERQQQLFGLINKVANSKTVKKISAKMSADEQYINEKFGSSVPGATLFAAVNTAAALVGTKGAKPTRLGRVAKSLEVPKLDVAVPKQDLLGGSSPLPVVDADFAAQVMAKEPRAGVAAIRTAEGLPPGEAIAQRAEVRGFESDAQIEAMKNQVVGSGRAKTVRGYHGTSAQFDEFNTPAMFSTKREYAEQLAKGEGGRVIEADITLRNPADLREMNISPSDPEFPRIAEELKSQGYDGAQYRNEAYIAFDNAQIKRVADAAAEVLPEVPPVQEFIPAPDKLSAADKKRLFAVDEKYPGIKPMLKYLTPEEARAVTGRNAQKLLDTWAELDPSEMASVALAGRAKRGWYEQSSKALVDLFGDEDAVRFSGLLAAMSPVTSVESNLRNALNTWVNWDMAGRPTDPNAIRAIMAKSVEGSRGADSVLGAWELNTIDALSAADASLIQLSGAKVDSFMRNIWGNLTEVTNDSWIAKYTGLDQTKFSSSRSTNVAGDTIKGKKTGVYMGINASTRKAAELLSRRTGEVWTPAEVQETIWSWSRSISNKADATNTPITDLIADLTNAEVSSVPDFGTLLGETQATLAGPRIANNEYQQILQRGGYGERLEGLGNGNRAASIEPTGTSASASGIQPRHLDAAAQRLEAARRESGRPKAIDDLRGTVDRSITGEAAPAFTRRDRGNRQRNIEATFSLPADRIQRLNSLGFSTPAITELRGGAERFHKLITASKESGPAGSQVYVYSPKEYENMRLFATENGKAGFALNGDDIVSVFNHAKSDYKAVSAEMLMLAIEQGGRRLDCFDTFLPHLYESLGFQVVRREPWKEKFKPPGWDKKYYKKYNNGEPDVVFMEYRPTTKLVEEMAKKGGKLDLKSGGQAPVPISQNIDLSRFDERLRKTLG